MVYLSSLWGNKQQGNTRPVLPYVCPLCNIGFPTSHALGGHQNGHKRERAMAKHLKDEAAIAKNLIEEAAAGESPLFHPAYSSSSYAMASTSRTPKYCYRSSPWSRLPSPIGKGYGHDAAWSKYLHDRMMAKSNGGPRRGIYEYPFFSESPSSNDGKKVAAEGNKWKGKQVMDEGGDDGMDLTLKL